MNTTRTDSNSRPVSATRMLPFLLPLAAVAAYANSFAAPFLFDDSVVIVLNRALRTFWPMNSSSRPVADLTFRIDYAVAGLSPATFHATNLAIHTLAGLFLFGCIRRSLLLPRFSGRYERAAPWLAAACASLWLVHPLQTESVTYICQRYESLAGLFTLLSLYALVRGATSARHRRTWCDAAIVACAVGMGTKATMVVTPVLLLLYDTVLLSGSWRGPWRERRWVHVGLFLTLAFYVLCELAFTIGNLPRHGHDISRVDPALPPLAYFATQFGVILHYLRLSFWPHPLCLDYAWEIARDWRDIVPAGLLLAALGAVSAFGLLTLRPWGFLAAAFFVTLAPTSSVAPVADIAFEHRMYLPLAAVVTLAVVGCHRALCANPAPGTRAAGRTAAAAALWLAALLALGRLTIQRNADYQSEERAWSDVVAKRPANFRARMALGRGLLAAGKPREAERVLRRLVRAVVGRMNDGTAWKTVGANSPNYIYYGALNTLARALLAQGRTEEAKGVLSEAIRWEPADPQAYCSLAAAHFLQGRDIEGIAICRAALRKDPASAAAHGLLAGVLARRGAFRDAAVHYRAALNREPDHANLNLEYAWLLATAPLDPVRNAPQARRHAQRAVQLSGGGSFRAFDTLAAALAEAGEFAAAREAAHRALQLLSERRAAGPPKTPRDGPERAELADAEREIGERLRLYEQDRPYRQPLPEVRPEAPATQP